MVKKRVRRSQRTLTADERTRMRSVRQEVETEKEDLLRRGREVFADHEQALAQTIGDLQLARQSQRLRLQQVPSGWEPTEPPSLAWSEPAETRRWRRWLATPRPSGNEW